MQQFHCIGLERRNIESLFTDLVKSVVVISFNIIITFVDWIEIIE